MKGKILGNRYELIERIGGGGMAVVYKARCNLLNRYVAVKILRPEFTSDNEFLSRFKTESQAAASLSHPNIVSIYDVGSEDEIEYIVMEYVDGKTLKEYIIENGPIPWRTALNIAVQICSGLDHAHKNHIVHRDIKPHNILITKEMAAKVTDFGIARAVSSSTLTVTGNAIGSVHYFSPEQARGGYTDEKSDIYSLGIVLYEMLTGKVPHDGETPITIALKHLEDEIIPPIKLVSDIPLSVNNIVLKAVQKNQTNRYQSANEMLNDLYIALKEPDANFVKLNTRNVDDEPTQRINITDEMRNHNKAYSNKNVVQGEKEDMLQRKKSDRLTVIAALSISLIIILMISGFAGYYIYSKITNSGTEIVTPNIVGMKLSDAQELLKQRNIRIDISDRRFDDSAQKDVILNQSPGANIKMKSGGVINVVVSEGQETVSVPDLSGMNSREASYELEKVGLKPLTEYEYSAEIPKDYVIRQNPQQKMTVSKNTEVAVFISQGPDPNKAKVPNLIGMTESDAKALINKSGFVVGIVSYATDNTRAAGIVISQGLAPNSDANKLTKIDITVNSINTMEYNPNNPTQPSNGSTKEITISLSDKGEYDTFEVKVEVEGIMGKRVVYQRTNSRSDKAITIPITGQGTQIVRVYIDGKLDSEEMVDFGGEVR